MRGEKEKKEEEMIKKKDRQRINRVDKRRGLKGILGQAQAASVWSWILIVYSVVFLLNG